MTETILVTGAAGTTGTALIDQLADADVHVRAGVHSPDATSHLAGPGTEVVGIDFEDPDTLASAFEGVDRAYLLTPFVPDQTPLVENLVDAAVAADLDHLVRHSARGAGMEDPPYSLAGNHRAAEQLVEDSGIDYTHVRPTVFMQNLLGEAETIREQGVIYNPVGEPISFVDARDVAAVAAAVLTEDGHAGEAYRLTGPEAVTYAGVADVLSDVLDREVEHVQVSMEDAREAMAEQGMPEALIDGFVGLQEWLADGGGREVTSTVADLTGSQPRGIREFAEDYADGFQ